MFYTESIKIAIPNDLFLVVDYYMAIHIHVQYICLTFTKYIYQYELHVANSYVYTSCIATDLYDIDVQIHS